MEATGDRAMDTDKVSRRDFVKTAVTAGAGLALASARTDAASPPPSEKINVALVGCGAQGQILLESLQLIERCHIAAVADIWPHRLKYIRRRLLSEGHEVAVYADHVELLAGEKDLDAVIVATPDYSHAQIATDCLKAGKHVYCEKTMSNTLEGARSMVRTMKETGKLLQIGYQRRSNPRYLFALNQLLRESKICGQLVAVNGQWNRSVRDELVAPKKSEMPEEWLRKYGFENMREFMNWRWFRKFSGGPLSFLGAHQIDIFNWFLGCQPKTVFASGGSNHYKDRELYDNAMVVYEYATPGGDLRASYQVQTASSCGHFFERFMGTEGSLRISENPAASQLTREKCVDEMPDRSNAWTALEDKGWIGRIQAGSMELEDAERVVVCPTCGALPPVFSIAVGFNQKLHQPHLENFFKAIRGEAKLACPGDEALRSEYSMFKALESMEARRMLVIDPKDVGA
jgi:predicted dehydrogenase